MSEEKWKAIKPISISKTDHRELQSSKSGEKYSFSAVLSDSFGFTPGRENAHVVENPTSEPLKLLVIASNPEQDEVFYS